MRSRGRASMRGYQEAFAPGSVGSLPRRLVVPQPPGEVDSRVSTQMGGALHGSNFHLMEANRRHYAKRRRSHLPMKPKRMRRGVKCNPGHKLRTVKFSDGRIVTFRRTSRKCPIPTQNLTRWETRMYWHQQRWNELNALGCKDPPHLGQHTIQLKQHQRLPPRARGLPVDM